MRMLLQAVRARRPPSVARRPAGSRASPDPTLLPIRAPYPQPRANIKRRIAMASKKKAASEEVVTAYKGFKQDLT
ncbi:hypothetical protein C0056_27700, partial [Pseudomonas aeruginosa]